VKSRYDWIAHLPADEAEREARALMESESDEATERYWERVMAAGRELERKRGTADWSREWVDDRDHAFKDDLPRTPYMRPNGAPE
jgi:uncharacterized glyoxalase superfamily protein PhnB